LLGQLHNVLEAVGADFLPALPLNLMVDDYVAVLLR
jgi:hypothetical protein